MADIFIAYSSRDRDLVSRLVELLSPQWSVWWDDKIIGDFSKVIETEMGMAKCLLPIWSSSSRESANVRDELDLALENNLPIIPAKIEHCKAPLGYGAYSTIDLSTWDRSPEHADFLALKRKLASVIPPREKSQRAITLGPSKAQLPSLFLSVSSHETQLVPLEAVKALRLFNVPNILISAYDMIKDRRDKGIIKELRRYQDQGGIVLMDSGNYEASRLDDTSWCIDNFEEVLGSVPHDLVFSFDVMKPSSNREKALKQIINAFQRDKNFTKKPVFPIVHAQLLDKKKEGEIAEIDKMGGRNLTDLPILIREVAEALNVPMIAVPERELGPGLIARAHTVKRIRDELDKLPFYQALHVLGTGNPWSIAVLAAAGADSFDGLEWCRMAVDRWHHRLNHFQHFDFFKFQADLADSEITRTALTDSKVDFAGKVALHNLDYYAELARLLSDAALKNNFEAFVTGVLGHANTKQLTKEFPELFK